MSLRNVCEAMDFLSAAAGIIGVCWPLGLALADARDFAQYPDHRATPTSPWTFFVERFRRRLRRWVWIWPLLVLGCSGLVGVLTWFDSSTVMDTTGNFSWIIPRTFGEAAFLAVQVLAYTVSSMLLATAVFLVFARRPLRPAVAIPVTVAATALLLAGIIALFGLPPPTKYQYSAFSYKKVVGTHYMTLSSTLLPVVAGAFVWFYLGRDRMLRPVAEEEAAPSGQGG